MNHALLFTGLDIIQYGNMHEVQRTAGAHKIATYLRNEGWDVEVCDFIAHWTLEELKEYCRARITSSTVFAGFSVAFNFHPQSIHDLFQWIKKEYPHVKTVIGGAVAHKTSIKADWYVVGFAEHAILELVKNFLGTNTEKLKFQLKGSKKVVMANLDYPAFPMSSLRIKYEDRDYIHPNETLTTELGRGCIFSCDFCNFPVLGVKGDYSRDAVDYDAEIRENYDRWGTTSYSLADETINDRTEKLQKFANVVSNLPFKIYNKGFLRPDLLIRRSQDWDFVEGMQLWGHHYGVESFNYPSAKSIGKGMPTEKLKEGLLMLKKELGRRGPYLPMMSLIYGLPHETPETVKEQEKWLLENWRDGGQILYPLNIWREDSGSPLSKFSKSWAEKGYRLMSQEEIDEKLKKYPPGVTKYLNMLGMSDSLLWANEHWDIFDTVDTIANFHMNYILWDKPLPWALNDFKLGTGLSEAEVLKKTMKELRPGKIHKRLVEFAHEYKAKKLSR